MFERLLRGFAGGHHGSRYSGGHHGRQRYVGDTGYAPEQQAPSSS